MKNRSIILIVDDQPQNIELLEAYLVQQGHLVIKATSGAEALEKVSSNKIDLILLDVMMPGMSGIEVLEKLRADEKTRLIPVVMVTALKETEDKIKAFEAECDDFISKPFDEFELLVRVKSILKMSYYRRQLDEKEKFKAVFDKMSDGIAICDSTWIIRDSNVAVLKYLNIADQANVNLVEALLKNYSISITKEALTDLTTMHKTFEIVREESKTTKALYLEANLDAITNPAGEISSIVFTLRDVTAARTEESLKQSFFGLISHKLRTPLGIIAPYAAMLKEGNMGHLNKEQQEAINTISKHSVSLIKLVNKLLGFTEVYGQKFTYTKETIELKAQFFSVADPIIKSFKNKKIELTIDCQESIKLEISKLCFDQTMGNLIENAVKFNDKDIVKIFISAKKIPGKIEISVTDNGIGIPNEEYEHIFEKFYQVEKCFTGQIEGVGLGLAVVKKMIEGEGGEIRVESKLKQGSTFIFTLPVY